MNVTRWRKHWLFGEKIEAETEPSISGKNGKKKLENAVNVKVKKRIRGWFPRQCAAEFFEDNDSDDDEDFEGIEDKKKN